MLTPRETFSTSFFAGLRGLLICVDLCVGKTIKACLCKCRERSREPSSSDVGSYDENKDPEHALLMNSFAYSLFCFYDC